MRQWDYRDYDLNHSLMAEVDFESAKDFLTALNLSVEADFHPLYMRGDISTAWIYRGQEDAAWGLMPSAHRPGAMSRFLRKGIPYNEPTNGYQMREEELDILARFIDCVSEAGLEIPHDFPELRDHDNNLEFNEPENFPSIRLRGICALAQHYRVPTRLLDWSHNALYAAYFASVDAAKKMKTETGRLAVWALNTVFLRRQARGWPLGPVLVTAPTASNPNLGAQQAVFTLVRYHDTPASDPPTLPSIDALYRGHQCSEVSLPGTSRYPMLFKFTLPWSESRKLLCLLDRCHANAIRIFPGHAGAALHLDDQAYHAEP